MALDAAEVALIADLVGEIDHKPVKVLSFGHPDILATPEDVQEAIGGPLLKIDNERVRRERIGTSHPRCVGTAFELFDHLGCTLATLDHRDLYGIDEDADLNYPLPERHRNAYDIVIDPGTTEHVLNIGQALVNVVTSLRLGGYVYHCNPMCMFNHGYWNYSPVAYHDFYTANGCEIIRIDRRSKGAFIPVEQVDRFRMDNDGKVVVACVARKVAEIDSITFPMQTKYRNP